MIEALDSHLQDRGVKTIEPAQFPDNYSFRKCVSIAGPSQLGNKGPIQICPGDLLPFDVH